MNNSRISEMQLVTIGKLDFLYVMQRNRVTRLPANSCSNYSTCSDCLKARDPYCGWCSLSNR